MGVLCGVDTCLRTVQVRDDVQTGQCRAACVHSVRQGVLVVGCCKPTRALTLLCVLLYATLAEACGRCPPTHKLLCTEAHAA